MSTTHPRVPPVPPDDANVAEIDALAALVGGRVGVDAVLDDLDRRARRTLAPGRAVHRALTLGPRGPAYAGGGRRASPPPRTPPTPRTSRAGGWSSSVVRQGGPGAGDHHGLAGDVPRPRPPPLPPRAARGAGAGRRRQRAARAAARARRRHRLVRPLAARRGHRARVHDLPRRRHPAGPRRARRGPARLGVDGSRVSTYGYRYVLPVRFAYRAPTEAGRRAAALLLPLPGPRHDAARAGRGRVRHAARRPAGWRASRSTPRPCCSPTDEDGRSRPLVLDDGGVGHMQGATVAPAARTT